MAAEEWVEEVGKEGEEDGEEEDGGGGEARVD